MSAPFFSYRIVRKPEGSPGRTPAARAGHVPRCAFRIPRFGDECSPHSALRVARFENIFSQRSAFRVRRTARSSVPEAPRKLAGGRASAASEHHRIGGLQMQPPRQGRRNPRVEISPRPSGAHSLFPDGPVVSPPANFRCASGTFFRPVRAVHPTALSA